MLSKFQSLVKTHDNFPAATANPESGMTVTLSLNVSLLQVPNLVFTHCYFFSWIFDYKINQYIHSHLGAHVHMYPLTKTRQMQHCFAYMG